MSESGTNTRILGLDGLRFLAFFSVFIFHIDHIYGWWGVDLFFVISGYLISGILLDNRGATGALRSFYLRRILRIFPPYFIFVLTAYLLGVITGGPIHLLAILTFTANLSMVLGQSWESPGHLWSIAQEEQFYLLWPLLITFLPRARISGLCLGLIGLSILGRMLGYSVGLNPTTIYLIPLLRLDGLALGALFALHERGDWRGLQLWSRFALPLFLGGFGVTLFATNGSLYDDLNPYWPFLGYTVVTISAGSLFLLTRRSNLLQAILELPPLRYLGRISYGLYLWTPTLQLLFKELSKLMGRDLTNLQCSLFALFVSFYISAFSWHFIETPILKLKKRLPYR